MTLKFHSIFTQPSPFHRIGRLIRAGSRWLGLVGSCLVLNALLMVMSWGISGCDLDPRNRSCPEGLSHNYNRDPDGIQCFEPSPQDPFSEQDGISEIIRLGPHQDMNDYVGAYLCPQSNSWPYSRLDVLGRAEIQFDENQARFEDYECGCGFFRHVNRYRNNLVRVLAQNYSCDNYIQRRCLGEPEEGIEVANISTKVEKICDLSFVNEFSFHPIGGLRESIEMSCLDYDNVTGDYACADDITINAIGNQKVQVLRPTPYCHVNVHKKLELPVIRRLAGGQQFSRLNSDFFRQTLEDCIGGHVRDYNQVIENVMSAAQEEEYGIRRSPEEDRILAFLRGSERITDPWPVVTDCVQQAADDAYQKEVHDSYVRWIHGMGEYSEIEGYEMHDYFFNPRMEGRGEALVDNIDMDNDGVCNIIDSCPFIANRDEQIHASSVYEFDRADLDGIGRECDNCPGHANYYQFDLDEDEIGDECDICDGNGPGNLCDCNEVNCGSALDRSDRDGDAVNDAADNCIHVANPIPNHGDAQIDIDQDGQGNACDPYPQDKYDDCDGDGQGASQEQAPYDATISTNDRDLDNREGCTPYEAPPPEKHCAQAIADLHVRCDNCPSYFNPEQENMDGDDLGDVCDPDMDGDGTNNVVDNCPRESNANQADMDEDHDGDICDFDIDGDLIHNERDNCPRDPNPDQRDDDANGIGWVCDDGDGDGVINSYDNCPLRANPTQEDLNMDGVGDACSDLPLNFFSVGPVYYNHMDFQDPLAAALVTFIGLEGVDTVRHLSWMVMTADGQAVYGPSVDIQQDHFLPRFEVRWLGRDHTGRLVDPGHYVIRLMAQNELGVFVFDHAVTVYELNLVVDNHDPSLWSEPGTYFPLFVNLNDSNNDGTSDMNQHPHEGDPDLAEVHIVLTPPLAGSYEIFGNDQIVRMWDGLPPEQPVQINHRYSLRERPLNQPFYLEGIFQGLLDIGVRFTTEDESILVSTLPLKVIEIGFEAYDAEFRPINPHHIPISAFNDSRIYGHLDILASHFINDNFTIPWSIIMADPDPNMPDRNVDTIQISTLDREGRPIDGPTGIPVARQDRNPEFVSDMLFLTPPSLPYPTPGDPIQFGGLSRFGDFNELCDYQASHYNDLTPRQREVWDHYLSYACEDAMFDVSFPSEASSVDCVLNNFRCNDDTLATLASEIPGPVSDNEFGDRTYQARADGSVVVEASVAVGGSRVSFELQRPVCASNSLSILPVHASVFEEPYLDTGVYDPVTFFYGDFDGEFTFVDRNHNGFCDCDDLNANERCDFEEAECEPFLDVSDDPHAVSWRQLHFRSHGLDSDGRPVGGITRGVMTTQQQISRHLEQANAWWSPACIQLVLVGESQVIRLENDMGYDLLGISYFTHPEMTSRVMDILASQASPEILEVIFTPGVVMDPEDQNLQADNLGGLTETRDGKTYVFVDTNTQPGFNVLTHEIGHAVCGIPDANGEIPMFYPGKNFLLPDLWIYGNRRLEPRVYNQYTQEICSGHLGDNRNDHPLLHDADWRP